MSRVFWRSICAGSVLLLTAGMPAESRAQQGSSSGGVSLIEKLGAAIPLDVQLNDETGGKVTLRQLIDKPTILTLNYFTCGGICTPQLNNLARTLNEVKLEPAKDFNVVTVSFDERDKPDRAAQKRINYLKLMRRPFPPVAWHFLTGDAAATKAVADAVGFQFKRHGDTFVHPGALIILSPEGKVTRYLYGITYLPAELEMALGDAAKGVVAPTVSRLLRLCFSYNPASRTYAFNFVRVGGAVVLLLVGVFVVVVLLRGKRDTTKERRSP